jgi:hypothetical protein
VFNGLHYALKTGAPWGLPTNLPPSAALYQQTQRVAAGRFEDLVDDQRGVLRSASKSHLVILVRRLLKVPEVRTN